MVRANKPYADALKMKPQEIIGKTCYELVHGAKEPPPYCPHKHTLDTAIPAKVEFFEPHLGSYMRLSLSPILNKKGEVTSTVHVLDDITERKQAEEELEKHRAHLEELVRDHTAELEKRVSEVQQLNDAMMNISEDLRITNANLESTTRQLVAANSELEAFSYSVSHDLRAPLRAIDGFSNALFEDYYNTLDDEGKRLLNTIRDEAQRMGCLIDDLLSFSRMGRKEMRQSAIDMGELAKSVLKELKATVAERNL
jgi:PAS domain S-box-containing protein